MSTTPPTAPAQPKRVINLVDREPDWDQFGPEVRKIVLGPSPGENVEAGVAKLTLPTLPPDFRRRFPRLTHLYLWSVAGLTQLPILPDRLECLDLRGCRDVRKLPPLPATLKTFLLDDCVALAAAPDLAAGQLPGLRDASLNRCAGLPETWVLALLRAAPSLRRFEASGCAQLTQVPEWPAGLVDLRLNQCPELEALPEHWPAELRRLELREARKLAELPAFPRTLDYINLEEMSALRALPERRGRPRTLYLFGAGLLMPPASELGERAGENVAARTAAYFEDVALTGPGEVKRCKVLLLGNGGAGKTSLALAAATQEPPERAETVYGSTHGVQFWLWVRNEFRAKIGSRMCPVQVQVWDFGGQEIYHNTHQLFMGKGAVFVVVWNPEQDGKQAPATGGTYQDEWRPLSYWLEFVRLACPHNPKIAVVCSHHKEGTPELKRQLQTELELAGATATPCYFFDSKHGEGDREGLEKWLRGAVGEVVTTQGVCVPAYWEIAQNMVQALVIKCQADPLFADEHKEMAQPEFQAALEQAIREAIRNEPGKYQQLDASLRAGKFILDADRLARTLSFLTHSGWLFWKPDLFESRVIIDQEWALKGLYDILERRQDKDIYRNLVARQGRFTLAELGEWAWNKRKYTPGQQALLLSFMKRCGLCCRLRPASEAAGGADVYFSFEHLPSEAESGRLQAEFVRRSAGLTPKDGEYVSPRLHALHWQKFLVDAATCYGAAAQYAADAFYLENQEGEVIFVQYRPEPGGLGGKVVFQVVGGKAEERLVRVKKQFTQFLPGGEGRHRG